MKPASRAFDQGLPLALALTLFALAPLAGGSRAVEAPLIALCLLLGSGGMYAFCARRYGRLGGVIGGLLYAYSPALVGLRYIDADMPALLSLALFPALLWRVDCFRDRPTSLNFTLVVPLTMAQLVAQPSLGLTLTALAFVWVGAETLIQHINREASQLTPRSSLLALLALIMGGLGAAPLWWPASADSLPSVVGAVAEIDALLAPPAIADGALTPALGIAQWTLATLGVLAAAALFINGFRTRHPQSLLGVAVFSLLALALIVIFPLSPGPVAACLAILGAANGLWLERLGARYRLNFIALIIALPIASSMLLLTSPALADLSSDPGNAATLLAAADPAALDVTLLFSLAALALALLLALRLRGRPLTPRPYWSTPPLQRYDAIGVLLGGLLALLIFVITAGQV